MLAILQLLCLALLLPIFYAKLLHKNANQLNDLHQVSSYGTLYNGLNLDPKAHWIWSYPLVFFVRRSLFVVVTVYFFDWPSMQMAIHLLMTLGTILYYAYGNRFDDNQRRWMEIMTEGLLFLFSSLLQ